MRICLALLLSLRVTACGTAVPSAENLRMDPHGRLVWAARTGDTATIERLAAEGVDLNAPDAGHNHWTPLQHAVHKEQAGAVRVLLDWGANPDATASNQTPLFMAADSEEPEMVRLLLDAGANIRAAGPGGRTALTQAVSGGALWDVTDRRLFGGCRTANVRALLSADRSLRAENTKAWHAAIWWARVNDCEEVLELVRTWTSHTIADKIVTSGGMMKDALGIPSPKDVLERRRAKAGLSQP